jgi:predicted DNA-binding transcriptional regulator YafY
MTELKRKIWRAIHHPDQYVLVIIYQDVDNARTKRVISPTRFTGQETIRALCLCREEHRQFHLTRMVDCQLAPANDFLMPVPMESVS